MPQARQSGMAIDLFAGAGGVSAGFRVAGAHVVAAVEMDPMAAATYRENHRETLLVERDISLVDPDDLRAELGLARGDLTVLGACAPCQGYSSIGARRPDDPRNDLVLRVLDFVRAFEPGAVAFENVPRLAQDARFAAFVDGLRRLGYGVRHAVVDAADFGVPQRRKRLVLFAMAGRPDAEVPALRPGGGQGGEPAKRLVVRDAFAKMKPAGSGDPLHAMPTYPQLVLDRIRAVPKDGGGRRDLPPELRLRCHARLGSGAASAYGRMRWDDVAPTLTTRCTTPSCGRFLHPEEDRAITLREAAALQTFPSRYEFKGGRLAIEAQIGNAIPVDLAAAIWRCLLS